VEKALRRRRSDQPRARPDLSQTLSPAAPNAEEICARLRRRGLIAPLRALDLLPRPPEAPSRQAQKTALVGAAAQTGRQHDLIVDLRRNVMRAPGCEQQVVGRPLLCALLAHLAPDDGVYSAERLFYEVWGGREYHPLRHRNTIYVAITRLRRALQDLLPGRDIVETTPHGWRLAGGVSLCVIPDSANPTGRAPAA
jgi:DNA-binding response OmpR family regulator